MVLFRWPLGTDTEDGKTKRKAGAAFTVIETVVEQRVQAHWRSGYVTVVVPVAAVLAAENVTWLEPLVGFVANTAVTPLAGRWPRE